MCGGSEELSMKLNLSNTVLATDTPGRFFQCCRCLIYSESGACNIKLCFLPPSLVNYRDLDRAKTLAFPARTRWATRLNVLTAPLKTCSLGWGWWVGALQNVKLSVAPLSRSATILAETKSCRKPCFKHHHPKKHHDLKSRVLEK